MEVKENSNKIPSEEVDAAVLEDAEDGEQIVDDTPRKVPAWAIMIGVVCFIVFNLFFLAYAMQMGSSSANPN